jgi:hypothetical protein
MAEFPLAAMSCRYGLGRYDIYVSAENKSKAMRYLYGAIFLWWPATTLIRLSIAFTLLRLKQWSALWTKILWIAIVVQTVVGVGCTICALLQCRPLYSLWESVPNAKCWEPKYLQLYGWVYTGIYVTTPQFAILEP